MSFASLEFARVPLVLIPSDRASSLEVHDAPQYWGIINPAQRLLSEGSEPCREVKEELLEVDCDDDADPSSEPETDQGHFSIAIVGVTAVAGIERVIDLPVLHSMAAGMFSCPKSSVLEPAANPAASDFKNSVQFNLHMPSVPRPVSGRLFKNGKITLSSVKTFCVTEVFDAIINEVKEAHVRAKTQVPTGVDVISGWTDGSPISVVGGNMRLSLQLQFQLPFPVNYKKIIRHLKCGMQFVDNFGGILIRCDSVCIVFGFA